MVDPLATYWTVETGYPFGEQCGYICNPTIAPSSVLYYEAGENGVEAWDNSVLIPTLKHGVLYVQHLTEGGQEADGLPVAWFNTQNRYRDVIASPDGREIYIATDAFGSAAQLYGEGLNTSVLHNPGAILKFTYGGESGSATLGVGMDAEDEGQTEVDSETGPGTMDADRPEEWEDPATGGSSEDQASSDEAASDAGVQVGDAADVQEVAERGLPKFSANCASCHGANGQGGAGATLAGNENLADVEFVAETLIHGFGYMPAFGGQLSDQDIAEIGTYIRNAWGNDFGLLEQEAVADAR